MAGINVLKILLVDDEQSDLDTLGDVLESAGYSVVKAGNYYSALELGSCEFDLLILDVVLPGHNAFDLVKDLSTRCNKHFQTLFISGYSGAELLRFYGVPVTDLHFLAKPFSAKALLERVRSLVESGDKRHYERVHKAS